MKWNHLAIALCSAVAIATSVDAQRSIRLGIGGGASTPVGKSSDRYATGGNVLGAVIWGGRNSLVGARVDYSANTFMGRRIAGTRQFGTSTVAVTGNLIAALPVGFIKPYVIGGGGWYPYREANDTKRENDFGFAGGAGITFPFVVSAGFLEGRFHKVSRETTNRFVTVSLGMLL